MTTATDSVASDRQADQLGSPGKTYAFLVVALATFLAGLAIWQVPIVAVVAQAVVEFRIVGEVGDIPNEPVALPAQEELVAQIVAEDTLRAALQRTQKEPLEEAKFAKQVEEMRQRVRVVPEQHDAAKSSRLRLEFVGRSRAETLAILQTLSEQSLIALHGRSVNTRLQADYIRAVEHEQQTRRQEEKAFREHEVFLARHFDELRKLDPTANKKEPLVERAPAVEKTPEKPTEKKPEKVAEKSAEKKPAEPKPAEPKPTEKKPALVESPARQPSIHVSGPTAPAWVTNPHTPGAPAVPPVVEDKPGVIGTPANSTPTATGPSWSPPQSLGPDEEKSAAAPVVAPTAPPVAAPVAPAPPAAANQALPEFAPPTEAPVAPAPAPAAPVAPMQPPSVPAAPEWPGPNVPATEAAVSPPPQANPSASAPAAANPEQLIRDLETRIAKLRQQQEELAATRTWVDPEVRALVDEQLTLERQLRDLRNSLIGPPLPAAPPSEAAPSAGPAVRPSRVSQITPIQRWHQAPATTAPVVDSPAAAAAKVAPLELLRQEAQSLAKSHEEMRRRWKLAVDEKLRISRQLEEGPRIAARVVAAPRIESQMGGPEAHSRVLWLTLVSLLVGGCVAAFAGHGDEAERLQSKEDVESWLRLPIWGELHFGERPVEAPSAPLWVWGSVRASELILMAVVVVLLMAVCLQSSFAQQLLKDPLAAYSEAVSLVLPSRATP